MDHYDVDSSVILEIVFKQENEHLARKLFQLSGYRNRYMLSISPIVLGEVLTIISKERALETKEDAFSELRNLLFYNQIHFYGLDILSLSQALIQILEADPFFRGMDVLVFASTILNKSKRFYTFDKDFLESNNLKAQFDVQIADPSTFRA